MANGLLFVLSDRDMDGRGEALAGVTRLAAQSPPGVGFEWTGISYEQQKSGSQTIVLYGARKLAFALRRHAGHPALGAWRRSAAGGAPVASGG